MIGYPIALAELNRWIDAAHPTKPTTKGASRRNANKSRAWRQRAKAEILRLRRERTFSPGIYGELWRDLKSIYTKIQGNGKCAYCETKLSRRGRGGVSGDIEHYRPKDGVQPYLSAYGSSMGSSDADCYYLLAYLPSNYVLACPTCNQDLKRNYFPIAGKRCSPHSCRAAELQAEQPYLINPLDPTEPDPEMLIEFVGITPVARAARGTHDYWRAMVTIELFHLTGGQRLDLDLQRATVISNLFIAMQLNTKVPHDPDATKSLALLHNNNLEHRNCARSFERLYRTSPSAAKQLAQEAHRLIASQP